MLVKHLCPPHPPHPRAHQHQLVHICNGRTVLLQHVRGKKEVRMKSKQIGRGVNVSQEAFCKRIPPLVSSKRDFLLDPGNKLCLLRDLRSGDKDISSTRREKKNRLKDGKNTIAVINLLFVFYFILLCFFEKTKMVEFSCRMWNQTLSQVIPNTSSAGCEPPANTRTHTHTLVHTRPIC